MARDQVDAVIVGGGSNGLAAAITLAERGCSVLVVERRAQLGGAVATESLTLPGFSHDTFSAVYPAAAASPVFTRMPLQQHGLRWIHPPIAMAHPLPDGRAAALYRSIEQTAANLDCLAPGDGTRWYSFIAPYMKHFDAVRTILLSGFPPVRGSIRLLTALGVSRVLDFARLLLLPATTLAAELFTSAGAAAWLYGSALHSDVKLDAPGSALAGFYLNLLGHGVGWPSPEGGAARLTQSLVSYLHTLGGQTRTDTAVERITVERQRVTGVIIAGGVLIRTPIVIANLVPRELLRLAGESFPPDYRMRLQRYRYGAPTLKVDWALSAPIPWTASEAAQAGTVHVGGAAPELLESLEQQQAGIMPDRPFLLLGQQSLADATRAPPGKHTAWAYTHPPPGINWTAERERYVDRIEAQIERFAPGFRNCILAQHVLSPPDLEQCNPNLVNGDVGGGSYTLDQLVFRPIPALSPYRTPIHGLYLASAATFPGGAVHGVAGHAAARLALFEVRLRRFW